MNVMTSIYETKFSFMLLLSEAISKRKHILSS